MNQLNAALKAVRDYRAERNSIRRRESQRIFGHTGAHISGAGFSEREAMRRALLAIRDDGTVS